MIQNTLLCFIILLVGTRYALADEPSRFLVAGLPTSVAAVTHVRNRQPHINHGPVSDALLRMRQVLRTHGEAPSYMLQESLASISTEEKKVGIRQKNSSGAHTVTGDDIHCQYKDIKGFELDLTAPLTESCTGDAKTPEGKRCKVRCGMNIFLLLPGFGRTPTANEVICKCPDGDPEAGTYGHECFYNIDEPKCNTNAIGWAFMLITFTCPCWCCGGMCFFLFRKKSEDRMKSEN